MHLDIHLSQGRKRAVQQHPLVQQGRGRLDDVGFEAFGDADRIIRGIDRNADLFAEPRVAQRAQTLPELRAQRREQVGGGRRQDRINPVNAQTRHLGANLGFDELGASVGPDGGDRQAERQRTRQRWGQQGFGAG